MPERREPSKGRYSFRLVRLRLRARGEGGQTIVEFALVAMVFFMLVFGIIDFSRLFHAWVTVEHAAREGARYGITGRTDCDIAGDDRPACIEYVAKQATTGLSGAPDNVTVSFKSWEYPDYTQEHSGSAGEQCDALEVSVDYDFQFAAPIIADVLGAVQIPITGRERMVNEPFGPCEQ